MFTTIRVYSGAPGLAQKIGDRREALEKLFRAVPGFAGYRLVETADGLVSVTICETKDGCDESSKRAAAWVKENFPDLKIPAPTIVVGQSLVSFGSKPSK
jgi:hypothetical protein